MKKIRYVKIIETHTTTEPESIKTEMKFILKGELFKVCNTIEEIRDRWYELRNDNVVIEFIEIYTYKNKKDLDMGKQFESLCE